MSSNTSAARTKRTGRIAPGLSREPSKRNPACLSIRVLSDSAHRTRLRLACLTAVLALTSCARNRPIVRGPHPSKPAILTATKAQLLERVSAFYNSVQSLHLVADLTVSRGSVYKGEITDYADFKGFIDFRKPGDIRVVALLPLFRSEAFLMVSHGGKFHAYLNNQNRFIEGEDDAPPVSESPIENMRPKSFLSALLVQPLEAQPLESDETPTLLMDDTTEKYSHYILQSMRRLPNGGVEAARTVTFDRVDLRIIEQREYAPDAAILSLTSYDGWKDYSGVSFPAQIRIMRYLEAYGATLNITQLDIDKPVPDSTFVFERPEGSTLQVIGEPANHR
jgi:hypothetical protein